MPTPIEIRQLFSELNRTLSSEHPLDKERVISKEFKASTERLIFGLSDSLRPGFENLMNFARRNAFDWKATQGIWMAVGIAAAKQGPRQKDWINQAGIVSKNLENDEGFHPLVYAMKDAYLRASNGERPFWATLFSKEVSQNLVHLTSMTVPEILPSVDMTPEFVQSDRSPEEFRNLFAAVSAKIDQPAASAGCLAGDTEYKRSVETLISNFDKKHPGIQGFITFSRENNISQDEIRGILMAVGIAAATTGPRQHKWLAQASNLGEFLSEMELSPLIGALNAGFEQANADPWLMLLSEEDLALPEAPIQRSPEDFRSLFGSIAEKISAKDGSFELLKDEPEFLKVIEKLFSDFQKDAPRMEDMVSFVLKNGFQPKEIIGVWNAFGIAAATPGPRQALYINYGGGLAETFSDPATGWEGSHMAMNHMKDAFRLTCDPRQIDLLVAQNPNLDEHVYRLMANEPAPGAPERAQEIDDHQPGR